MSNNNFETGKTCGLVEPEDKSSASLLCEKAMAELKEEHEAQFSHKNFTNLVDQFEVTEEDSQNSSCTEDEDNTLPMSQTE